MAQEATSSDTQKVTVTGSNIKRAAKEGTSPIDVITAKDIRNSGAANVTELMRNIPALAGSGYADTANQNSFSRGVSTASLRGLGSTSTLILLNGRRITPSAYANPNNGQSTQYDLNSIPISALERVEVFKDGASAIYGSDAIGGVINFITRKDYQGGEISAGAGANDDNHFGQRSVAGTYGFGDYESNGYNIWASASFSKTDRVALKDANNDIQAAQYADMNFRMNPYSSNISNSPFFYRETKPGSAAFTTGASVVNLKNCDPSRLVTGGPANNITSGTLFGRTFCNYDINDHTDSVPKGEDISLLTRGTFKLGQDTQGVVEAGYTSTKRQYRAASPTISGTTPVTNFLTGGLATPFQAILPIGHPDNPFTDVRAAAVYRFENIAAGSQVLNEGYRVMANLNGTIGNWNWDTALLWNRSDRTEDRYGSLYLPTLRKLYTENRSLASLAADPTLSPNITNKGRAEILQYDAKVSTEFGKLGGGAIGLAAGIELREEKLTITPDALNARGDIYGLATTAIDASRHVSSGFFELRTPWLKNFETDVAGRFDKYPGIATNFVPTLGGKWTANDTVALRANYAKGFRAPAVSQTAAGGAQYFVSGIIDPIRCPGGSVPAPGADTTDCNKSISGVGNSNPSLTPEKSKSMSFGVILTPTKDIDIVIDWYRIRKEGEVALSGTQYAVDHESTAPQNVVRDTNPANFLLDASGKPIPGSGPLLSVLTPWTNQGATEVRGIDYEVKVRSALGTMGKLVTSLNATYILSFQRAEQPGDVEANLAGTNGGISDWTTSVGSVPRLKGTLSFDWTRGDHELYAAMNYIAGVSYLRRTDNTVTYPVPYCHFGTGQPSTAYSLGGVPKYTSYYPDCATPSFTTVDMNYTYTGVKNLTLSLGIKNLFDTKAPYTPGTNTSTVVLDGYDSTQHTNYGRYFTLSANYKFK